MPKFIRICSLAAVTGLALVFVCCEPDTCGVQSIPGRIDGLALEYNEASGEAVLLWTAPGSGSQNERAARYEIRYSYSSPLEWENSACALKPPVPGEPGSPQAYTFFSPIRGRDLYAAVRAYGADGNVTAASDVARARINGYNLAGSCKDIISRSPVAGLEVTVTGGHVHQLVSDAEGRFQAEDLTSGTVNVSIRSGVSGTVYHSYGLTFQLASDTTLDCLMIEYQEAEIPLGINILTLFEMAAALSPAEPILKKWRAYPIKCYITPFTNNGLDFEEITREAADHWMNRTGIQLFTFVDVPPDTGVTVSYHPVGEMGIHVGFTHHENDDEIYPLTSEVFIVDTFTERDDLWVVALHEFGHTIRFGHLPAGYLMHASLQDMAWDVTPDETKLARLYTSTPNPFDVTPYDTSDPR